MPAGFEPGDIALAEETLRELAPLGPPHAAFLGGSKAFGLGNALSDVDLTVVYDDAVLAGQPRVRAAGRGDVALHCELVGLGEYEALCRRFSETALPAATSSLDADAVLGSQRRMTEFLRGPYLRTSPLIEDMRASLAPERVDALCAAAAAVVGALSVRDAAGAARSGDWLTAAASAEMALEYALDAALFAAGDPYRSRKFLPRRLSCHPDLAPFVDVLRSPGRLPAAARMREALLVANGVQAAALLGLGPVWTTHPDGPGPVRDPFTTLVTTAEGLRLVGTGEYGVGRPAATLWLLADGRPLPALVTLFAEAHGLGEETVAAFVETNVEGLRRAGAVEVR